ncbi:hypothetical protein HPB50_006263 [Hyalomma asiaticum]|uniref:Uncharacterized protein n=1 Tax=Hyalomma asiaticum TaxID=266040 RepID=A0ACB7SEG0_HYAAI|nr:hypothetical protein HPB50_006263 [Hyalomma asiaticum]
MLGTQQYHLVQTLLNQLDDQFWLRRSTKANQFILSSMAGLLSEVIVGETLGKVLTPVVVRVAVVTNAPVAFYVVPVSLAASINVMLPVSLPLLIMREYLNVRCAKMVVYGVFLKCTAVIVTVATMNTLGTIFFSDEVLSTNQCSALTTVNTTHVATGPMQPRVLRIRKVFRDFRKLVRSQRIELSYKCDIRDSDGILIPAATYAPPAASGYPWRLFQSYALDHNALNKVCWVVNSQRQ